MTKKKNANDNRRRVGEGVKVFKAKAGQPPRFAIQPDSVVYAAMCGRTPGEWRELLLGIDDERVRFFAACVVYWDFFGSCVSGRVSPELDEIIDTPNAALYNQRYHTKAELLVELVALGYHKETAEARIERSAKLHKPKACVKNPTNRWSITTRWADRIKSIKK